MSRKNFQIRHNVPPTGPQNTLHPIPAIDFKFSGLKIPHPTKPEPGAQPRATDDNPDSNSKLPGDTLTKKIVRPPRKPLVPRVNPSIEKKQESQDNEKLPRSAPNNVNSRPGFQKQISRISLVKTGEDRKKPLENKNEGIIAVSNKRQTPGTGASTQRKSIEQSKEQQEDRNTDDRSTSEQTEQERISNDGAQLKYNMKYRGSSRGQDEAIEEDISQDKMSKDGKVSGEDKGKEEESADWHKKSMDFTLSQLTPEKNSQAKESEIEQKEYKIERIYYVNECNSKGKNAENSRRKDSVLTNTSANSTRPESEIQSGHPVQVKPAHVRGMFTKEHIPHSDLKRKQEQMKVMKKELDMQVIEKKRMQNEERARQIEAEKREEERIKKELELMNNNQQHDMYKTNPYKIIIIYSESSNEIFGRQDIYKRDSPSTQPASKRASTRKKTEDNTVRSSGEGRISEQGDAMTSNKRLEYQDTMAYNMKSYGDNNERQGGYVRVPSGEGSRDRDNIGELLKENHILKDEVEKKEKLIDILMRALNQTEHAPTIVTPPNRIIKTEISPPSEINPPFISAKHQNGPRENQLLDQYLFNKNFAGTQYLSNNGRRPLAQENPREIIRGPQEVETRTPDFTLKDFTEMTQGSTQKTFFPSLKPSGTREKIGFPEQNMPTIQNMVSPLKSPTLAHNILLPFPTQTASRVGHNGSFYSHNRALTSPDDLIPIRIPNYNNQENLNYGLGGDGAALPRKVVDQVYNSHFRSNYQPSNILYEGENIPLPRGLRSPQLNGTVDPQETTYSNPFNMKAQIFENRRMPGLDEKLSNKVPGTNILVLDDAMNLPKQEGRPMGVEASSETLPQLRTKGSFGMAMKRPIKSDNKGMEFNSEHVGAGMQELGRGKSSGTFDQTARFPKEVFATNGKKKFCV